MAIAIYLQDDEYIDYTPSADVAAGDVVVQGSLVGIARKPIPASTLGALAIEGVFTVAKATGAITSGAPLYWDATNHVATGTSSGNTYMGMAIAAAASDDTTVKVLLLSGLTVSPQTALALADGSAVTFGTSRLLRTGNNIIATLPTSDPVVAGALYVTSNTVKVSTGS
jgi:predicted RecA/RadA family phage recombinase